VSRLMGKIIGTSTAALCVIALVLGIAFIGIAHTMPAHVDEQKAHQLTDNYDQDYFAMSPQERVRRAGEIVNLRTAKWSLYNIGICICLVAATFAVSIIRFRLWDMRNLMTATTPRTRWRLITLGSAAWLALIPAFILEIHDEYKRDDLRPYDGYGAGGDSIVFLMTAAPFIILIWLSAALICRFVVLRSVDLPAGLWSAGYRTGCRNAGLTAFYGMMIALLVAFVALSAVYGKWAIPSGLVGIYVMLSSWAGLRSREVPNP
jgi:hypothetical protein